MSLSKPVKGKQKNNKMLEEYDERSLPELISRLKSEKNRFNQEMIIEKISSFKSEQSARQIIPLLKSENAYVRNAGIEILQNMGEYSLVVLEELIKDSDKNIRKFALDILKEIRTEKSSILAIEGLRDNDSNVLQTAIEVLGIHKYEKALPQLLSILKEEMNIWVLDSLINALGNFEQVWVVKVIEDKIEKGNFQNIEKNILMNSFVRILSRIGTISYLEKLVNNYIKEYSISDEAIIQCISGIIISNDITSLSLDTAEIIESIYKEKLTYDNENETLISLKAASKLQLKFYLKDVSRLVKKFYHVEFFEESLLEIICELYFIPGEFIKSLLEDQSIDIKVFALKIIRQKKISGFEPEVVKLCDLNETKIACEALRIVSEVESYMNETLLKRMSSSVNNELSSIALEGLINQGMIDKDLYVKCLKHASSSVRKLAVKHLISVKDKVDIDELISIVNDFKETTGLEGLEVVLRLDSEKAKTLIKQIVDNDTGNSHSKLVEVIDLLDDELYYYYINILANDSDYLVRRNVIKSLSRRINHDSFKVLSILLENETNENNKYEIITELYKFNVSEVFNKLVSCLDYDSILLKLAAIESLASYGDKRAIEFLNKYVDSDIPDVSESVNEALERLGDRL